MQEKVARKLRHSTLFLAIVRYSATCFVANNWYFVYEVQFICTKQEIKGDLLRFNRFIAKYSSYAFTAGLFNNREKNNYWILTNQTATLHSFCMGTCICKCDLSI